MKTILTMLAAVALLGSTASAQELTIYVGVKSDYSFSEFGFTQYDEPVLQGGITTSYGNGFFLDYWRSEALDGNVQGREVDYTVGWAGACGNLSCSASISLFDIPTPNVGDLDFTGTDIIRFRATVSDTIEIDANNSINLMLGADQLTGLIETNLWRTAASWNHTVSESWSTNMLLGVTHSTDSDYTSPRWEASTTRSFENWSLTLSVGGFNPSGPEAHHVTYGASVSRTW
ncbi:MAG: TorF family putative porin [Patescibacteria group bacterium UBA2103]